MKNRLIAAITATAIAMTSAMSTPALADSKTDKQVLTLLLGAAALGILLNESKKNDRLATTPLPDDRYVPPFQRDHDYDREGSWMKWHKKRLLPSRCAYQMRNKYNHGEVVSYRCLADYGLHRRLPKECGFDIRGRRGTEFVYGAKCLIRNGYRFADI
ncbi:MAG: hypothetical protein KDE08_10585 [Rhodobacteraceae bacterium]|nr:hypothetical protein [Paracoccaceae bacterium]